MFRKHALIVAAIAISAAIGGCTPEDPSKMVEDCLTALDRNNNLNDSARAKTCRLDKKTMITAHDQKKWKIVEYFYWTEGAENQEIAREWLKVGSLYQFDRAKVMLLTSFGKTIEDCENALKVEYKYDDPTPAVICNIKRDARDIGNHDQLRYIADFFWAKKRHIPYSTIIEKKWLDTLARKGDGHAIARLAEDEKDAHKKLAMYALAVRQGHVDSDIWVYRTLDNNPGIIPNAKARAKEFLQKSALNGRDWAKETIKREKMWEEVGRRIDEIHGRGRSSRDQGDDAAGGVAILLGAIVLLAIANGADTAADQGVKGYDRCAEGKSAFAWSGGDLDVAAAVALGGCSAF